MATVEGSAASRSSSTKPRVGVLRVAGAAGLSAAIIFVLCWLGLFIPLSSPTHAYVGLFTSAEMRSVQALAEGSLWSLLFGFLSGAVFASVYNGLGGLDRR